MKSENDFYVFPKWREAPTGAFGIENRPAVVPPEDKEAYWHIYSELLEAAKSAIAGVPDDDLFVRPKSYSLERGSRGHRPVDLWVSICGQGAKAFGFMPQIYAIASGRGLEVGFAASIPESDYFDPASKSRNRALVPLINSRLPNPTSPAALSLAALLAEDGGWVFSTQTRLSPGDIGYNAFGSLSDLLTYLKTEGTVTGGGCIARVYSLRQLAAIDLENEFRLALERFRPLLKLAKPTNWDLRVLEAQSEVEGLNPSDPFDPSSIDDGRRKVLAEVARRQGQAKFRRNLLKIYEGACAISGYNVADVLEAAHIVPYLGQQTNHVTNGILLRADIHTLFDLGLMRIIPDTHEVVVSPALAQSAYQAFNGTILRLPSEKRNHPSMPALQRRWEMME
ncbi:HNH endonuclease [Acetobacter indonesiensis]|uniref:HNH endonuclease n=1 Tax=Acetobacter indonesiensis TaxID=104101 RepID=UPI0039E7F42A